MGGVLFYASGASAEANLALNAPASSAGDACVAQESPSQAVNASVSGGLSDKWCSLEESQVLQLDLGALARIDRLVIKHAGAGGESREWNTRDFSVRVSVDAVTWTPVVEAAGNTEDVTEHDVASVSARYVQVDVTTSTSNGDAAARIYEVEVYGQDAPDAPAPVEPGAEPVPAPEPAPAPAPEPAPAPAPGPVASQEVSGTYSDVIGIGTRFDWAADRGQFTVARDMIRDIGFKHVRVGLDCECRDLGAYQDQVVAMAKDLDLQLTLQVEGGSSEWMTGRVDSWLQAAPGHIYALEGANETYNAHQWWDPEFPNALELQNFIKATADARGLQSFTMTQGGPIRPYVDGDWPNMSAWSTHANFHAYPWDTSYADGYFQRKTLPLWQDGSGPRGGVEVMREWGGGRPLAITEWGYSWADEGVGAIRDQDARAKYIVRNTFEIMNAGISHSNYYSLVDEDNRFGLGSRDGERYKAAQVLDNTFALVGDAGRATGSTRSVSLSTTNGMSVVDDRDVFTDEVHSLRLSKPDGSTWLVMWVDSDSHEGESLSADVTVDFGGPATVRTYLPFDSTSVVQELQGDRVTVTVPDHPILLEIR